MKRNRKWYVCYTPDYIPGEGKYVTVKTKKAMWKVLNKFGSGSEAFVRTLKWHREGGYTLSGTEKVYSVR